MVYSIPSADHLCIVAIEGPVVCNLKTKYGFAPLTWGLGGARSGLS
ncbi:MAG: hypothetical protein AAF282_09410 [Cyanobacteria bacterium P01_A01_bin.15]